MWHFEIFALTFETAGNLSKVICCWGEKNTRKIWEIWRKPLGFLEDPDWKCAFIQWRYSISFSWAFSSKISQIFIWQAHVISYIHHLHSYLNENDKMNFFKIFVSCLHFHRSWIRFYFCPWISSPQTRCWFLYRCYGRWRHIDIIQFFLTFS